MPSCLCNRNILHVSGGSWGDLGRDLVIKDDDVCEAGGQQFFHTTPHASSFAKFFAQGATGLPPNLLKNMTLTSCIGLQQLVSARNLLAWPASTTSSGEALLFAEVAATLKKKRISVGLAGDVDKTVVVKRPSHPCDRVAIIMEAKFLDNVFAFILSAGFAGEAEKKVDVRAGV